MWVRRVLLPIILLGFVALTLGAYFFHEPRPDARLACYYGAYDLDDGRLIFILPSSGTQNLRFTLMDGDTGRLHPEGVSETGVPTRFVAGQGWASRAPVRLTAEFGACSEGRLVLTEAGATITGKRRSFAVIDTTFKSHGVSLAGRLVMPAGDAPVPIAVLLHGSERDSAILFNRLQYLLPTNGIGAFVYDKRGTGKSQGTYTQDFHLLSDDGAAAFAQAKALAGARASEIGFQGGSQAGWIAPLAAGKANADFVLVGYGLVESPLAEDREEVFDDLRSAGYGEDAIAKAREITDATGRVMASDFEEGFDRLDAVRAKYEKEPWYEKVEGEYTGDFLRYPNWMIKLLGPLFDVGTSWEYDPLPALEAYQGPHLWILAGRDSSAPSENTLRILREIQVTHPNLDVVVFPTADHGIIEFVEKDGKREDTRYSPGYFQLIVDWIKTKSAAVAVDGPIVHEGGVAAEPRVDVADPGP